MGPERSVHDLLEPLRGSVDCDAAARLTFPQLAAIAVPSRFRLLKLLGERRATLSELHGRTGLAKSTVHGHLHVLEKAGLVTRHEDERKWVYHALTPLGRSIAAMDPLRLVVVLGAALGLAIAGAATMMWAWLNPPRQNLPWGVPPIGAPPEAAPVATETIALGALLLVAGLSLAAAFWRRARCVPPSDPIA